MVFCVSAGLEQVRMVEHALLAKDTCPLELSKMGPRKAICQMGKTLADPTDRVKWAEEARLQAIVGSCPAALMSARSGMRAWLSFCRGFLGRVGEVFPPEIDDLLAWSRLFRHEKTFGNYVSYVRLACEVVAKPTDVFNHPSLKRAKLAIAKRGLFARRQPRFIQLELVGRMVSRMLVASELLELVMLCGMSYAFLLRVPSEGLPVAAHGSTNARLPVFSIRGDTAQLYLPKRKNRSSPSTLYRKCWCKKCPMTCPVHIVGKYFMKLKWGTQPFQRMRPDTVMRDLRRLLMQLHVPEAVEYRTHDLRRGHAEDLRQGGSTLGEILRAGDWKSPAFLQYLDQDQLERDRTAEAHMVDSSDDE